MICAQRAKRLSSLMPSLIVFFALAISSLTWGGTAGAAARAAPAAKPGNGLDGLVLWYHTDRSALIAPTCNPFGSVLPTTSFFTYRYRLLSPASNSLGSGLSHRPSPGLCSPYGMMAAFGREITSGIRGPSGGRIAGDAARFGRPYRLPRRRSSAALSPHSGVL